MAYSTDADPGTVSGEVTVDVGDVWLIHPGVPALSQPVELFAGSFEDEQWPVQRGVHYPMGATSPVVQTDGSRKSLESSITVAVESLQELAAMRALLRDASVLLLNIPGSLGWGVDTAYISVGQVRNRRVTGVAADALRALELPFIVVDRPVGGTQSERTYTSLLVFSSYDDLAAAYGSYADLLAGP